MEGPVHSKCELYSYADTTVAGKNCAIIKYTEWSCDVAPFSEKCNPMKDIPIVSASTGFTSENGRNYILIFHEALYMPNMRHTLTNPNECRHFGAKVQDNPYNEDCSILIESPDKEFTACLQSIRTVMFLYTWFPMQGDLKSYPHIEVISRQHCNHTRLSFYEQNII